MIRGILMILVTNVTMQTGNGTNHNNGGNIRSKGKPTNHRTIRNRGNMVTIETRGTLINLIIMVIVLTELTVITVGGLIKLGNEGNHCNSANHNDHVNIGNIGNRLTIMSKGTVVWFVKELAIGTLVTMVN
jgi:hypothetical protein